MTQSCTSGAVSDSRFQAMRKMRTIATGLLVLMAVTFILARTMEVHHTSWGYFRAFAEAAMVGALADWFAVVALFRHPLGLPIPHTAIIPNNKDRIGESLGRFVTDNFLTTTTLRPKLEKLDLVGIAAGWLTKQSAPIAERVCGVIPAMLKKLDDAAVRRFLHQQLISQMSTIEVAPLAGKLLEGLTAGDKHRALLGEGLRLMDEWFNENRDWLHQEIRDEVPLPAWLGKDKVAGYYVRKFINKVGTLVHDVGENHQHPFHAKFRASLEKQIHALKNSPDYLRKGEEFKAQLLEHPVLRTYVSDVWATLEQWILTDLAKPDSQIKARLRDLVNSIGRTLQEDAELRERLNTWLRDGLLAFVEQHREQAARLIQDTVAKWEAEDICRNLEAEVGRDLQFIRISGTIVGGLVGLLIHLASKSFWP